MTERTELEAHAARAYPDEACGVILTREAERTIVACRNIARPAERATRYVMGLADMVQIDAALDGGWALDAVWHSHVDAPPAFSSVDRAQALDGSGQPAFPYTTWKIVAVRAGVAAEWKAYRWNPETEDFVEVPAWP